MARYYARVEKVYPPKYSSDPQARDAHKDPSSSAAHSLDNETPHAMGGDLKISANQAILFDDPARYYYWVHILELEKDKSHDKGKSAAKNIEKDGKMIGSLMEVQYGMMRFTLFHNKLQFFSDAGPSRLVVIVCPFQNPSSDGSSATVLIAKLLSLHHGQ